MGWANKLLEREARPHWYVVFCDGVEIGSAPSADDACGIARKHARGNLDWTRKPSLWFAVVGESLYEVRKLKQAKAAPASDVIPRGRRHG